MESVLGKYPVQYHLAVQYCNPKKIYLDGVGSDKGCSDESLDNKRFEELYLLKGHWYGFDIDKYE